MKQEKSLGVPATLLPAELFTWQIRRCEAGTTLKAHCPPHVEMASQIISCCATGQSVPFACLCDLVLTSGLDFKL